MTKSFRHIVTLVLTALYLLITLSPLAPLALRSPHIAHAMTGECVGDCDICGCSPEKRASHTCCCWQKKKLQHHHDDDQEQIADCCKKKKQADKTVLTCSCPCGSNKVLGLWGADKFEQLPYRFGSVTQLFQKSLFVPSPSLRPTDRHDEPPDPPPRYALSV